MEEKATKIWMVEDSWNSSYKAFKTKEKAKEYMLKRYLTDRLPNINDVSRFDGTILSRDKIIADDILNWCNYDYIEDEFYLYDVDYFEEA